MQLHCCAFMSIVSSERSLNMTLFDLHCTVECTTEICHFGAIASSLLGFWDNWVCTWWVCQPNPESGGPGYLRIWHLSQTCL